MSAMCEVSFSVDPSGLSISGQGMASSGGGPPRNWKGSKTQCVNRLRVTGMDGFEPVALLPRKALKVETLYRKGKGFWARWRAAGIVAHGEHRDEAILALLATIRDTFLALGLSQREGTLAADELAVLRRMQQFLKIQAKEGESRLLNGDGTACANHVGLN